jgi:hypothetical protein
VEVCDSEEGCISLGDPCHGGTICNEESDICDRCSADAECDDGIDCTVDACVAGECIATPDDDACQDDGWFCNGPEVCDAEAGCHSAGPPCESGQVCDEDADICGDCLGDTECDDGVACTFDFCQNGECEHDAEDDSCADDGLFCNGEEFCNPDVGCISTGDPCPPTLVCNEDEARCVICIEDIDCNDGDLCTVDSCVDEVCVHEPGPACEPESYTSRDDDNDGVMNWNDRCPNSLPDEVVDGWGCPLEPASVVSGKSEQRYPIAGNSSASVGQGAGSACGAVGMVPAVFLLTGFCLMRLSLRRTTTGMAEFHPPRVAGIRQLSGPCTGNQQPAGHPPDLPC